MSEQIEVGSVVYLNSGSQAMTVTGIRKDDSTGDAVACSWLFPNLGASFFPIACLTMVRPQAPPADSALDTLLGIGAALAGTFDHDECADPDNSNPDDCWACTGEDVLAQYGPTR